MAEAAWRTFVGAVEGHGHTKGQAPSISTTVVFDFEDVKFEALDRLHERMEKISASRHLTETAIEDLELNFLERCDQILIRTVSKTITENGWEELDAGGSIRQPILKSLEEAGYSPEDEGYSSIGDVLDECLHLMEQLEDISTSWFSVVLLEPDCLKMFYTALEAVLVCGEDPDAWQLLRDTFLELMIRSPLLSGEDRVRFYLYMNDLEGEYLIHFMKHFLQAQLEYGQLLQEEYLKAHPDLVKKVRTRLNREVGETVKGLL